MEIKILNRYAQPPKYATAGSCALDLISTKDMWLVPGEHLMIPTGIAVWIGSDSEELAGLIIPRFSLGRKGLVLSNTIGLIDSDYQGELIIPAWNRNTEKPGAETWLPDDTIHIEKGDKVAQLLFTPIIRPDFNLVTRFSEETVRDENGFESADHKKGGKR